MNASLCYQERPGGAQQADVSTETRNLFLNKLLLEHGQQGIRQQLHTLQSEWVDKTYDEQQEPAVAASLGMEAATPPDDDEASIAAAGGGGSGQYCELTGCALVDRENAAAAAAASAGP